ncbi:PRC-barrel domain containing protein [Nocardioides seonyuensis]|uniref:PRC-barrel domain containing protein n=1 Tax=Nocardioides seonyuensis TaxID=2518371 RepID=A0A4P7II13_9ACTN|nr:PRC-barrel domain containing protein [Nocardioides seonyuensis]QBX55491.1 PRC-barrel domain containing protein [Nocardioides seonyuensis]
MNDIIWSYRNSEWIEDADLVGYTVNAKDGPIGKIHEMSTDVGASWLVVDTGMWIFGKKRLIPAGTVAGVDHEKELVIVNMSKAAIEAAPDHDSDEWDAAIQGRHADHYREFIEGQDDEVRGPRPLS